MAAMSQIDRGILAHGASRKCASAECRNAGRRVAAITGGADRARTRAAFGVVPHSHGIDRVRGRGIAVAQDYGPRVLVI